MPGLYCDVSLPVPLDQPFTYSAPGDAAAAGTDRMPLAGSVRKSGPSPAWSCAPTMKRRQLEPREALRLLDEEPVLDPSLLKLGRWISEYYCAPLGETLRAMTPLAADIRHGKLYSLTSPGHDAARQFHFDDNAPDPAGELLRLLDARPLTGAYLARKVPKAGSILRALEKKGLVEAEDRTDARRHRPKNEAGTGASAGGRSASAAHAESASGEGFRLHPRSRGDPPIPSVFAGRRLPARARPRCISAPSKRRWREVRAP